MLHFLVILALSVAWVTLIIKKKLQKICYVDVEAGLNGSANFFPNLSNSELDLNKSSPNINA